jgi:hypothetical protein
MVVRRIQDIIEHGPVLLFISLSSALAGELVNVSLRLPASHPLQRVVVDRSRAIPVHRSKSPHPWNEAIVPQDMVEL